MKTKTRVSIFLDDSDQPVAEFETPIQFELDTRKLVDGAHTLRIVGKDTTGKEGIRVIPFTVRNGPAIAVEGLRTDDIVDGVLPIMINAYGKGDQQRFIVHGSETPRSIPSWIWALIILFFGWAAYYGITFF